MKGHRDVSFFCEVMDIEPNEERLKKEICEMIMSIKKPGMLIVIHNVIKSLI